jgi:hypothetical protein
MQTKTQTKGVADIDAKKAAWMELGAGAEKFARKADAETATVVVEAALDWARAKGLQPPTESYVERNVDVLAALAEAKRLAWFGLAAASRAFAAKRVRSQAVADAAVEWARSLGWQMPGSRTA